MFLLTRCAKLHWAKNLGDRDRAILLFRSMSDLYLEIEFDCKIYIVKEATEPLTIQNM